MNLRPPKPVQNFIDRVTPHETRGVHCPWCNRHNDLATGGAGAAPPEAGDLAICARCGGICVFNADLSQRRIEPAEFDALPQDVRYELLSSQDLFRKARAEFDREAGRRSS